MQSARLGGRRQATYFSRRISSSIYRRLCRAGEMGDPLGGGRFVKPGTGCVRRPASKAVWGSAMCSRSSLVHQTGADALGLTLHIVLFLGKVKFLERQRWVSWRIWDFRREPEDLV
jgi:hypothetical protein